MDGLRVISTYNLSDICFCRKMHTSFSVFIFSRTARQPQCSVMSIPEYGSTSSFRRFLPQAFVSYSYFMSNEAKICVVSVRPKVRTQMLVHGKKMKFGYLQELSVSDHEVNENTTVIPTFYCSSCWPQSSPSQQWPMQQGGQKAHNKQANTHLRYIPLLFSDNSWLWRNEQPRACWGGA